MEGQRLTFDRLTVTLPAADETMSAYWRESSAGAQNKALAKLTKELDSPCCPNCRSRARSHKIGGEACRRRWLANAFHGIRTTDSVDPAGLYNEAMRVKRGELVWRPTAPSAQWGSNSGTGRYVSTEAIAA